VWHRCHPTKRAQTNRSIPCAGLSARVKLLVIKEVFWESSYHRYLKYNSAAQCPAELVEAVKTELSTKYNYRQMKNMS